MKNSKTLGLVAAAALFGFVAPASAGPWVQVAIEAPDPPNPDLTVGTGSAAGATLKIINAGAPIGTKNIFYAGPYELTVFPAPPSPASFPLLAWCDDLNDTFDLNHGHFYQASTTAADVNFYLNVGNTSFQEIAGLVFRGTFDFYFDHAALTPEMGAAFQMAIWELEYPSATVTSTYSGDANFQALVASLIANAGSDFTLFANAGWQIGQLEDPCGGAAAAGTITKNDCQFFQGIIFGFVGRNPFNVPEPITLSLFGAGLAGAAGLRRRKTKTA